MRGYRGERAEVYPAAPQAIIADVKKVVVILIVALIAAFVLVNVFAKPGAVTLKVYTDGDPFGVLDAAFMRRYRRHAIVVILVAAAVITPTSDVFTLLIVSLPIWLLYEVSIFLVRSAEGRGGRAEAETTNTKNNN